MEWPRTRNPRRKAPSHPTPWAWEAQAKLHREAKPPRPDNELLIVGRLGNSLTAVAWSEAVYRPPADPHVLLIFLGVDLAHQGRHGHGKDALVQTLTQWARSYPEARSLQVRANVHIRNEESAGLAGSIGLSVAEPATPPHNPYSVWAGPVRIL